MSEKLKVDREKLKKALEAFSNAMVVIEKDKLLVSFPESTIKITVEGIQEDLTKYTDYMDTIMLIVKLLKRLIP